MKAKTRALVILLSAIALIMVFLALQFLTPGEKIDQTGAGGAHIVYSADHDLVPAPGACLTVRWQADHIQAIYFNNLATIGQGIEQVCTDDTKPLPILHVVFQDNTSHDYVLTVKFWVEQPATWFLISAEVLLALLSLCVAVSRSSSTPSQPGGRRTPRRVLIFAGVGIVISAVAGLALVAEVELRFYFGHFGTSAEQNAYLRSRADIDTFDNTHIALPFVEYAPSPDFPGHNSLGYRGDEIQIPKPAGVYRIVALGDSSTYGAYLPYNKSYPADLQQVLRADYGYENLEVINAGVISYSSWNMLMDLAFRISELQPDLVIVYAGRLDAEPREVSPDCYRAPSPFLGLDPTLKLRVSLPELSPSALYRFLAIDFGWMPNPGLVDARFMVKSLQCPPPPESEIPQNIQANPPIYFERNLREMVAVAKASGIKLMFMSWAHSTDPTAFPVYRRPTITQHNAVMAQVAHETGTLFFDYAAIAPTDKASWNDGAHLSISGSLHLAQDIVQFLVDQQVLPPPPVP